MSAWTAMSLRAMSLKAMTDGKNLDGPLEQTDRLVDENRTIWRRFRRFGVVFDVSGVVLGVNDVFGRRFGR